MSEDPLGIRSERGDHLFLEQFWKKISIGFWSHSRFYDWLLGRFFRINKE